MKVEHTPQIIGKIIHGSGDGRKLGFPTANIESSEIPPLDHGVYATWIKIKGKTYPSVTHFGPRLVFDEIKPQIETYIFDFEEDIYGEEVKLDIVKHLRGSVKFDSLQEMIEQIKRDVDEAKKALGA